MRYLSLILSNLCFCWLSVAASAHDAPGEGTAHYLANQGVMIAYGDHKILFDPLPLTGFGTYADLPPEMKAAVMNGAAPYEGVEAVFVSHAHRDHFSAKTMVEYLRAHPGVRLYASQQAVEMMQPYMEEASDLRSRITSVDPAFGDDPVRMARGDMIIEAVRIPHAGWPARQDVQNLFWRVTLPDGATVMHMGDADIRPEHYVPYDAFWQARRTDTAFPPYWVYQYKIGQTLLNYLNVDRSVGTHVPLKIPTALAEGEPDYFAEPGETRPVTAGSVGCRLSVYAGETYQVCALPTSADIRLFWGQGETAFGTFEAVKDHLAARGETLRLAMNAGMYHADRSPVGLYVEDGHERTPLQVGPSSGNFGLIPNGVFFKVGERFGVMEARAYKRSGLEPDFATQSGPMLVIDGALHPKFLRDSTSRKIRNGVGVSADGHTVYFVLSGMPVTFHTFASFFRDHLKTPQALYLDGTVSRLYDPKQGFDGKGGVFGPIVGVVEDKP